MTDMTNTTTRSDGVTTMTGPADQPWVTLVVTGEEDSPANLDDVAVSLITMMHRSGANAETTEDTSDSSESDVEFATLTLHDEVVVTVDGQTLTSAEAIAQLDRGIKVAIVEALNRNPQQA